MKKVGESLKSPEIECLMEDAFSKSLSPGLRFYACSWNWNKNLLGALIFLNLSTINSTGGSR